ncbi:hypothetical protein MMC06_002366, partial [Schaereria dolodes]|nr:hypothetical protein [Schaereria dolodes]
TATTIMPRVIREIYTAEPSAKIRHFLVRQNIILAFNQCDKQKRDKWIDEVLDQSKDFAIDMAKESWKILANGNDEIGRESSKAAVPIDYFYK